MKIGNLYKVKKKFWLLYPTKEKAYAADAFCPSFVAAAERGSSYWSKFYNCEVTYFSPDLIVVFLEEDGELKKVLTLDGRIGWIWWFDESCKDCFEEMKTEE
jgi:hypothetical protein